MCVRDVIVAQALRAQLCCTTAMRQHGASCLIEHCCVLTACEHTCIGHTLSLSASCSGPGAVAPPRAVAPPGAVAPREECKYFRTGHCMRGDDCNFAHVANGQFNGQSNGQQLNGFALAAAPFGAGGSNGAFGFGNNAFAPALPAMIPAAAPAAPAVVPAAQGAFTFGGASQAPAAVGNAAAAMFGVAPAKPANVRASARRGGRGGRR
jgi:Zinc finger C-x8-C-x5-C-x3-H type (and similar)